MGDRIWRGRKADEDRPALFREGPQLQLDQELLGNQAVVDLTVGGRQPQPGILGFDNPNPKLDRRPVVPIGPVDDEAPKQPYDWTTEPKKDVPNPTPMRPEEPRGVDTTEPTIIPAGRRPRTF